MNITIMGTAVRRDEAGRYSVNDLHRAAGAEKRHQPSDWLRLQQTNDLVAALNASKPGIPGIASKQGLGTFVARELVYAYAMWISATFHLQVIAAYDQMSTAPALAVPQSFAAALQLAADQALALEAARPAVQFVERYVELPSGSKGFRQVAKLLNANEHAFRSFLLDSQILYRLGGELTPYQEHINAGRFEIRTGISTNDHAYNRALFTPKGVQWVAGLWTAAKAEATA